MLSIGTADQALHVEAMEAPGGFLWWYADLVSPEGDGVVLIWSFGLPFLPGRESAAAKGRGLPGREQPSLAISVYEKGRPRFYLLQAYRPEDAEVDLESGEVSLGGSRFRSWVEDGRRKVRVQLDLPVPGSPRLTGELRIDGAPLKNPTATLDGPSWHVWAPLTTATIGTASLRIGEEALMSVEGRAYHDCNGSTAPLRGLGIHEWAWGRQAAGAFEEVHYVLWPEGGGPPEAHLLRLHAEGGVELEPAEVVAAPRRYGFWGLPWHRSLHLRGAHSGRERVVQPGSVVDDGPFYLRSLLGSGTAEWVRPSRVDMALFRPFVSMCVHRPHGPNSFLLPFLTGDHTTRFQRLIRPTPQPLLAAK